MAAIRRLARELNLASIRGRVTLIPVANEAAFKRGARCGPDDLDLARTCPGSPAGSETERIAHELSALIRSADYYVDLHTGGTTLSVYPMTGYMLHPNPEILATQRRMARAFNLPIAWGTTPNLEGRTLSVARHAGIPAIYAEYHGSGACDPTGVDAYVEGCLNVMAELDMLSRNPSPTRVAYVVEDDRTDSGHMQIQYRSPCDGFFEPAVRLGDPVTRGQKIGTVTDVVGESAVSVESRESGIMLVLRTFPSVRVGDSLGVVLEMDPAR